MAYPSEAEVLARHGAFADPAGVVAAAFDALLPPRRDPVDRWAEEHRWVTSPGYTGRYSFDVVPFLREPAADLTSDRYATVCIVGPGQVGKTMVPENWLAWSVATDPASFLWFLNTEAVKDAYVKTVIDQLVTDHAVIRRRLGLKPVDNSLTFKRFENMVAEFLAATRSNILNKKAPRIVLDETDAYGPDLDDLMSIFDVRRQTIAHGSMLLAMSHPDKATGLDPDADWNAGSMAIYRQSTRKRWWWPCPSCNGFSSPAPGAARFMALRYETAGHLDEVEQSAHMHCPLCEAKIEDRHRAEMNAAGFWAGLGQEVDRNGRVSGDLIASETSGYWVVGAMSPFTKGGWGGMARRRVAAERGFAATGEDQGLRDVMSKTWGMPYERGKVAAAVDADALIARVEGFKLRVVPDAVRCLFATVDVNKTWFEVLVMGLASEGELWTLDHFKVLVSVDALGQEHQVNPARRAADWDLLTRLLVTRAYPLAADPSRGMRLRGLMVDSHGEAGVTRQAYNWWRRLRDAHDEDGQRAPLARREGEIDGRDVWTVALSRGLGGLNQPRVAMTYPDSGRRDRRAGGAGDVPVAQFNPTLFKNDAAGMLNQLEPGSGFIHFSNDLLTWDPETGEATAPHPFFDQLAAEAPDKTGRWLPVKEGIRNESWDLLVLTLVQMHLWGVRKYDWNNPPVWCRPADENPLVVPIGAPLEGAASVIAATGKGDDDDVPEVHEAGRRAAPDRKISSMLA